MLAELSSRKVLVCSTWLRGLGQDVQGLGKLCCNLNIGGQRAQNEEAKEVK